MITEKRAKELIKIADKAANELEHFVANEQLFIIGKILSHISTQKEKEISNRKAEAKNMAQTYSTLQSKIADEEAGLDKLKDMVVELEARVGEDEEEK